MMNLSSVAPSESQHIYYNPKLSQVYNVKLAECKTVGGRHTLSTSLGSCVAVCLYDKSHKIGGMAHVMLPDSSSALTSATFKPGRYADTAIKTLIDGMVEKGSDKRHIVAKIAGGARMLNHNGMASVGDKNVIAVREVLKREGIRLLGEDVNGAFGRKIEFYTDSGMISVIKIMKKDDTVFL
jgi:chemotaxis protein CheD